MTRPETATSRGASHLDRLLAGVQGFLPQHLLSRIVLWLTRLRAGPLTTLAIRTVVALYSVDLSQAEETDPRRYPTFDAFFTRALRPGARPLPAEARAIASPVDGTVSEIGEIDGGRLLQAKGLLYTVDALLGGSGDPRMPGAEAFEDGSFATLYLSPRDYHRIHMPLTGRLVGMIHVPGRLFSVQPGTVRAVPELFARNERVVALFESEAGPLAVVAVGAIFVGAIETVWAGLVTPPRGRTLTRVAYPAPGTDPCDLARGEEMGRFHMGSTVIVLFGPGAVGWRPELEPGSTVRMGQVIGRALKP